MRSSKAAGSVRPATTATTSSARRTSTNCAGRAISRWPSRRSSAASATVSTRRIRKRGGLRSTPLRPRCASTCTTTGSALRPTRGARRKTSRSSSFSRRLGKAKCSPPATRNRATRRRSSCRQRRRRKCRAATSSPAAKRSAASHPSGRGWGCTGSTRAIPRIQRSSTASSRATRRASRSRKRGT